MKKAQQFEKGSGAYRTYCTLLLGIKEEIIILRNIRKTTLVLLLLGVALGLSLIGLARAYQDLNKVRVEIREKVKLARDLEEELDSKEEVLFSLQAKSKAEKEEKEKLAKELKEKEDLIINKDKELKKKEDDIKALKRKVKTPNRSSGVVKGSDSKSSTSKGELIGTFNASAYTDNKRSQGKWVGKTASGMKPQRGVVAVDPKVIPLGTKLYIEGYGNAIAGDTGGAIKGMKIDLFMNTQGECKSFGRRNIKVYRR